MWSKRFSQCRYCSSSCCKHKARGLCSNCYVFIWEYINGSKTNDEMVGHFRKVFFDYISGHQKGLSK